MIFTFTFDDSYKSWIKASQILSDNGFKGVFNVCLRNVALKRPKTRQRMFPDSDILTWEELHKIADLGHEITSHGVRHVDLPLCNDAELDLEINGSYEVLTSHGFNVSGYTCAFNSYTWASEKLSRRNYDTFRLSTGVNELPLTGRTYHVMSSGDAISYALNNRDKNQWVVGAWHDVNLKRFPEHVKKIKESMVTVDTVEGVFGR